MKTIAEKIADLVQKQGGRVFYVGGYVRDRVLGLENKDIDIEVHGIAPAQLLEILKQIGHPRAFGESFGVYALDGCGLDVAMPRREYATGRGHKDFAVSVDPWIGPAEAARRRDFTVNALMEDVLTGEVLDPFGGMKDLKAGCLRHIDAVRFAEDPLRVFRAAQFAARFGFKTAEDTAALCRRIDVTALSKERVEGELQKALVKGRTPSVFFETLRKMGQLHDWFPEIEQLIGIEQDPKFHPEGDVWTHTMEVLDRAAEFRDRVRDPYAFMLLALTHDYGKIDATEISGGRIHAYGHETRGLPRIEAFLERIAGKKSVRNYVRNMVPLHMKPNVIAYHKSAVKITNKMFDDAVAPEDLIYFSMADRPVYSGADPFSGDHAFLFERLELYREMMERPYVTGKDLTAAGLEPGAGFGELLEFAHKLRLAGIEKESALKQTLAYGRRK